MSKLFFIKRTNCRGEVDIELSTADFETYVEMYKVFSNIYDVHNDIYATLDELEELGYDDPALQELFCYSFEHDTVIETIRANYIALTTPRGLTIDLEESVLGVGFTKQQAIQALIGLDTDLDNW